MAHHGEEHFALEALISEDRGKLDGHWEAITELQRIVAVYGETLDELRNRVYTLEHAPWAVEH